MTRKDYKLIASAIRRLDLRTDYKQTRERELLRDLVTELADELEADNPDRFNRDRFIEAALRELAPTP